MTTTTEAIPEPDENRASTTPVAPQPETPAPRPRRTLSAAPLVAVIVGGVLAVGMIFGGGVALGIALPIGDGGGTHQDGVPGGGPSGGHGRPGTPDGDDHTNPNAPSAPNQDDTETQDESGQG